MHCPLKLLLLAEPQHLVQYLVNYNAVYVLGGDLFNSLRNKSTANYYVGKATMT